MPLYIGSNLQQAILFKQILSKTLTELQFVEKNFFMKELNTQKLWTLEIGTQEDMKIPIWISVRFQQREREDSQNFKNDNF